jgi:REG-2-like HAD superfamily hydrolase
VNCELVTFDCAETLVRVRWSPATFAAECAETAQLPVDIDEAALRYQTLLRGRWSEYLEVNRRRDHALGDRFWATLVSDWLEDLGQSRSLLPRMVEIAQEILYGQGSTMFVPFDDVEPVLELLGGRGVRLAVISNWDYSLHRILRSRNLYDPFELVVASLEEGVEKPDPRLFHLTLERLGVQPSRALHVGDNPVDDVQGARAAGMASVWLDRARTEREGDVIPSLHHLVEVLGWTA